MKAIILTMFLALFSFNSIAATPNNYRCTQEEEGFDKYEVIFNFDRYASEDKVFVEVFLDGSIVDARITDKNVHADSHGDSWGMDLIATSGSHKYELYFDANYLSSSYITMPGLDRVELSACSFYAAQ